MIVFDTDKINVDGFTKLGNDYINGLYGRETGKIAVHTLVNSFAPQGAAVVASMGTIKIAENSIETKFVTKYRKQHPNTKLSNNEILKIRESR